jgi:hypothetical protein
MKRVNEVNYGEWRLVHERTGKPVLVGDVIFDFRGNAATVKGGMPPNKPSSTGRVWVEGGEYFPSVFDLKWVEKKQVVSQ